MPNDIRAAAQQAEAEITASEQNPAEVVSETPEKVEEGTPVVTQNEEDTSKVNEPSVVTPKIDDPLQILDSLQLDETQKKLLRDGFLRQADYTRKTQDLARNAKLIDEYNQFKPYIDKVLADPNLSKLVFAEAETSQEYPDDPKEYAQRIREETIAEMRKENEQREFQRQIAEDTKLASTLDPRLTTDPVFMKSIAGIVNSDPEYILNGGQKSAQQATKDALETYKFWEQQQKSNYRKDLEQELLKKKMVTPQSGSPMTTAGLPPKSIREAALRAEEELTR